MKSKKITIIALHLSYGGVEKAIIELANNLVKKYDVEIISTYKIDDKPAFDISNKVRVTYLLQDKPNKKEFIKALKEYHLIATIKEGVKSLKILYKRKHLLAKALKKIETDVIISTRAFHNKIVGKYINKNITKIAWEHNHHQNNKKYVKRTINSVKNMDYFVLVSKELYEFYKGKTKITCQYIPNSINISMDFKHNPQKKLIAIGRLEPEKGFLDLIDIFDKLKKDFPDYKLTIVGDGSQRRAIVNKINKLNLNSRVSLSGYLPALGVHKELDTAMVYLMTSYTESFGIVLIEAMAHGIPCIAFDSANGAKEIIKNKYNGYLIKDRNQEEFLKQLKEMLTNRNLYEELSKGAITESNKFDSSTVIKKWENLVESSK